MTYMYFYVYTIYESDTIACMDLQSFVHYYPAYKAALTFFFQYLNLLVNFHFYLVLIHVPVSDTQADF